MIERVLLEQDTLYFRFVCSIKIFVFALHIAVSGSQSFAIRRIITKFMSSNVILRSMTKVAIKYENTVPYGVYFT